MSVKKERKLEFGRNLGIYFSILFNYKWLFFVLLFVVLLRESFSAGFRFLFKLLVDSGTDFASGVISHPVFMQSVFFILLIYVVAVLFNSVVGWVRIQCINHLDANIVADLKRRFFNHIVGLSYRFHTTHKTGGLISKLGKGSSASEAMTDIIVFNIVPIVFQLFVSGAVLFLLDKVSALIIAVTVIVFVIYSWFLQSIQERFNVVANEADDREKANISDTFTNIDSIKLFGKEVFIKKRYSELSESTKLAFLRFWSFYRWLDAGQVLILGVGTVVLLYFSVVSFAEGFISVGTLAFIYTTFVGLTEYLWNFVHGLRNFYKAMADFEGLFAYDRIKNEVKDGPDELRIVDPSIEFRDVSFWVKNRIILSNFSLSIPRGKKIALVGPSGSGKTTVVKLLYRLFDPNSGEILIGGKNIKQFKQESLRSELSIVPQECVLFDDTIYSNIKFSNPDASRKDVFSAMRFAQLDKVIAKFPIKERTIVGERGVKLSGGERQRVSIARAILADKKIIVLDEATSALDYQTEHEIKRDLDKLLEGRTAIIIAHRLSTIRNADLIVVMDKGRIVQFGSHESLIRSGGLYKELWSFQKDGYIR